MITEEIKRCIRENILDILAPETSEYVTVYLDSHIISSLIDGCSDSTNIWWATKNAQDYL